MIRVRPPARDNVPRRPDEVAVPMPGEYAIRQHRAYDAERLCFVPGNAGKKLENGKLKRGAQQRAGTRSAAALVSAPIQDSGQSSFDCRLGSKLLGCARVFGDGTGAKTALHFGLDVAAQGFRNDARSSEVAEIGNRKVRQISKNCGKGCRRLAEKCDPNIVRDGPLAMMNDGRNDWSRKLLARESFQDLRFGQIRIIEDNGKNLRVAFRKKRARDARGTAPRQGDFLAERNLWKAREQLLLGVALEFGGYRRRKSKLNQVHQIEVADQAECYEAWTARMKAQRALDAIALEQRFALAHLFEDFTGKIFPLHEQAKMGLVESGIVEQG